MPKLDWKKKDEKKNQSSESSKDSDEFHVLESLTNPIIASSESNNEISKNKITRNNEQKISSTHWKNLLIWGENKSILRTLNLKFSNKIKLIYIDPPYATGANFESKTFIGESYVFEKKYMERRN